MELTDDLVDRYRNLGGFTMIKTGRTKIDTPKKMAFSRETIKTMGLDALVTEVMDLYRSASANGNLELRLGASDARIMGDPLRLRQVIHNLVKNAQEAIGAREDGQVLVETTRFEDTDEPHIDLTVQDNGTGFDEELLGRIFDPYVTTKAKGTGLGLAIVKKIIEEHGGMIWAENVDGGGARLVARLPLWQGGEEAEREAG